MKKIAFCLPDFRGGGAEKVIISLANEMSRLNNIEVYIFVGNKTGILFSRISYSIKLIELGCVNSYKSPLLIKKYCNKFSIDVIIGTLGMAHGVAFSKLLGNKSLCVSRIGNTISQDLNRWKGIKRLLMSLYQNILLFSDVIITQSDYMMKDLKNSVKLLRFKREIYRIYNPIDISLAITLSNSIQFINCTSDDFITIGRLEWQKDTTTIIKAFSKYNKFKNTSSLHILGDGYEKDELVKLCKELNISDKVIFHGFVDNPYVYLKNCKAFLMASRFEGFSNSILEAIALKTKVIVTNCPGGNSEIIKNGLNGLMYPVGDDQELYELMKNIDKFEPIFDTINNYEINNVTSSYLDLINGK